MHLVIDIRAGIGGYQLGIGRVLHQILVLFEQSHTPELSIKIRYLVFETCRAGSLNTRLIIVPRIIPGVTHIPAQHCL